MSLLDRLLRRPPRPEDWTVLWDALRPLGSHVRPEAVPGWVDQMAALPHATLVEVDDRLAQAYRLLDTEQHARAVLRVPFTSVDEPFARGRFVRVLDRVILGGPAAVARVAADPSAIGAYDTVPLLDPADLYSPDETATATLASILWAALARADVPSRAVVGSRSRATVGAWTRSRSWPTVRSVSTRAVLWLWNLDPEDGWLTVDASLLDDVELAPGVTTTPASVAVTATGAVVPGAWEAEGLRASAVLVRALADADVARALGGRGVLLEIVGPGEADATLGVLDDEDHEIDLQGELSPEDVAVDPADRVDVLVSASARALLALDVPWTPRAREVLAESVQKRKGPMSSM